MHLLRIAFLVLVVSGLYFQASPADAGSKKKPAAVAAGPAEEKGTVLLRVWKDAFNTDRALRVTVRASMKRIAPFELSVSEGRQFLEYQEVFTGPATLEITDAADAKNRLAMLPVNLSHGAFFTLLIVEEGGKPVVELIDDSVRPGAPGELTVRNFAPTLPTLRVKLGDDIQLALEGRHTLARVRGLPNRTQRIDTSGLDQSGRQVNWANEVDFAKTRRVTLLVFPDAYGRIRPRVVIDGALPHNATEKSEPSGE